MAGLCHAQFEVPEAVSKILENYLKDSSAGFGPLYAKKWRFLSDSIQIKDLKIGRVLQEYKLKRGSIDMYPDTIPLSEIIEPTGYWNVLITAHDRPQYVVTLGNSKGELVFTMMSDISTDNMWESLLKNYPESKGINPVLVVMGRENYLYFKQKGPRKIYYLRPGYANDPLTVLFPGSLDTLDDSRKLLNHWKKINRDEIKGAIPSMILYGRDTEIGGGK
jgi:hypothetical protein